MRKDAIYIDTPIPRKRPLPRRRRTIPVKGQPIEEYQYEKLYQCWYCGDINTTGRDDQGINSSSMISSYSMPRELSRGVRGQEPEESISVNRTVFGLKVAPIAGADGTARPIKNVWAIDNRLGCKACGTIDWH